LKYVTISPELLKKLSKQNLRLKLGYAPEAREANAYSKKKSF